MSVNRFRGEVALVVNGEARVARLSLGALVVLEEALEAESLVALVERFELGDLRARDVLAVLAAGLGEPVEAVASAEIEGGPLKAAEAAGLLIARAFAPVGG